MIVHEAQVLIVPLLISGLGRPRNDIDVNLTRLIEDLKKIWEEEVEVFDVHCQEFFTTSNYITLNNQ